MNKKTPLCIHFPVSCIEIESIYNTFKKVYAKTIPYKISLNVIINSKSYKSNRIAIKPFPVIHKEYVHNRVTTKQVPALGYKFTYENFNIFYSGDTVYCNHLAKNAKGSDLAIIEAGHDENTSDEIHMTLKEAKSIGQSAKEYFLVHMPES